MTPEEAKYRVMGSGVIVRDPILYRCVSCSKVYTREELVPSTPTYLIVPPCWSEASCSDRRGQVCLEYHESSTIDSLREQAARGAKLQKWFEAHRFFLPEDMQVFPRDVVKR